jgi:hypothetical protein
MGKGIGGFVLSRSMSNLINRSMIDANYIQQHKPRPRDFSLIRSREYLALGLVLFITLLNGLIFLFLVPPWQHYDEPSNFEYAWLIANRPGMPQVGDYDATMRRQVAASMIEFGFFARGSEPVLETTEDPVWIGTSQIEDKPFTYWVTSLPLRLFRSASITNQLYLGRFVSLIFYLFTVVAAWGIMKEITPRGSSLRWLFPTSLAIMPNLSNLMTSLNSDAGAVALFSLFLWGSVRLIQRGFSAIGFALVVGLAALCLFTKITVYFAVPLLVIVLLFALIRGKRRKWAWILLGSSLLIGSVFLFTFGDAAYWYRSTNQSGATRALSHQSVLGEYVIELNPDAKVYPSWHKPLYQPLLIPDVVSLRGKSLTLGAWIWATDPDGVAEITFSDGVNTFAKKFRLSTEPSFYVLPASVADNSIRAWITLNSLRNQNKEDVLVFYDGIVLTEGNMPADVTPVFTDDFAAIGIWGGKQFTNLIRNASGELRTFHLRPWFDRLWSRFMPNYSGPSFNLHYILDYKAIHWHYRMTAYRLFTTFWGQFGWGNVPLRLGPRPYFLLGVITGLAGIGAGIKVLRDWKKLPWESLFLLGISFIVVWVMAVLRGTSHLSVTWLYLPVARYAFPAIIPSMLFFTVGLLELFRLPSRHLRLPHNIDKYLFLSLMLGLFIASLRTILLHYYLL